MDLAPFEWMRDGASEPPEPRRATDAADDGPPPLPPSPLELLMTAACHFDGEIRLSAARPALGRELIAAAGSEKIRSLAATRQAQLMWKELSEPERQEFVELGAKACQRYLKHVGEFYSRRARQTEEQGDDFIERWHTNQLRVNAKQTVRRMMLPTSHDELGRRRKASAATQSAQRAHARAEPSARAPTAGDDANSLLDDVDDGHDADLLGHGGPRSTTGRPATS